MKVLDKKAKAIVTEKLSLPCALWVNEGQRDHFEIQLQSAEATLQSFRDRATIKLNTSSDCVSVIDKGKILNNDNKPLLKRWDGEGEVSLLRRKRKIEISDEPPERKQYAVDDKSTKERKSQESKASFSSYLCLKSSLKEEDTPHIRNSPLHSSHQTLNAPNKNYEVEINTNDKKIASVIEDFNSPPKEKPDTLTKSFAIPTSSSPEKVLLQHFTRLEEKVDNLGRSIHLITDVLENVASCKSCIKGVLKVIRESSTLSSNGSSDEDPSTSASNFNMPLSQTPKPLQQLTPSPVHHHFQQVAPSSVLDPSQSLKVLRKSRKP